MALDPVKNFAIVEVSTGYDDNDTSISLVADHGAKLPAPSTDGEFNLVWWNFTDYPNPSDDSAVEIVRCTGKSTDTLTITRAQEGTSASNKNTAGKTYKMMLSMTQKTIDDIETDIAAKQTSDAELTALAGLTSAANKVPMFSGSGTATVIDFKDEDDMASDSATAVPSQQSTKAYADAVKLFLLNMPEGTMVNGKIVPSVASNNLTVAIKGKDGNDPSATNPVYVMIGGTLRTITGALSVTCNAGTNYCNAGRAELATKEIDYFVYLLQGTNTNIGFSRFPGATKYDEFNNTDVIYDKSRQFNDLSGVGNDSPCVVIGRFAATLSAGAGYTWTVPTYTASNLIQRPIFETRDLDFVITASGSGSMTVASTVTNYAKYKIRGNKLLISFNWTCTTGGSANNELGFVYPFAADDVSSSYMWGTVAQDAANTSGWAYIQSGKISCRNSGSSNWGIGAGRGPVGVIEYSI